MSKVIGVALGILLLTAPASAATSWHTVASGVSRSQMYTTTASVGDVTVVDPTELRARLEFSKSTTLTLHYSVLCWKSNLDTWSRSGERNISVAASTWKSSSLPLPSDPSRFVQCDVSAWVYAGNTGTVRVKLQRK